MRFFLFKLPKTKRFHYEPLYYDPVKEAIKQREKEIKKELSGEVVAHSERISLAFSRRKQQSAKSNRRQIILMLTLFCTTFGVIQWGYIGLVFLSLGFFVVLDWFKNYQKPKNKI